MLCSATSGMRPVLRLQFSLFGEWDEVYCDEV
jgi:hypothetical protein